MYDIHCMVTKEIDIVLYVTKFEKGTIMKGMPKTITIHTIQS